MTQVKVFTDLESAKELRDEICANLCSNYLGLAAVGIRELKQQGTKPNFEVLSYVRPVSKTISEDHMYEDHIFRVMSVGNADGSRVVYVDTLDLSMPRVVPPGTAFEVEAVTSLPSVPDVNFGGVASIGGAKFLITAGHRFTKHREALSENENGGRIANIILPGISTPVAVVDERSHILTPDEGDDFDLAAFPLVAEDVKPRPTSSGDAFYMVRHQPDMPSGGSVDARWACAAIPYRNGCRTVNDLVFVKGRDFGEKGNSGAMIYDDNDKPYALTIAGMKYSESWAVAHPVSVITEKLGWEFL